MSRWLNMKKQECAFDIKNMHLAEANYHTNNEI